MITRGRWKSPLRMGLTLELSGATVVVERKEGRRDHYYLAERLAKVACTRIFLMQRSSTLVLGPEQGWGAEKVFYEALLKRIDRGTAFLHIISLDGITRHLERPQSTFPDMREAVSKLSVEADIVGFRGPTNTWQFRKIPAEAECEDLKPDRQARTFIVEPEIGPPEGVLVVDLGGMQSCFHLCGPEMQRFFEDCIKFYENCHLLRWSELKPILGVDPPDGAT